jgi:hypothetical protein
MADYLKQQIRNIEKDYCLARTCVPFGVFARAWVELYAEQYRQGGQVQADINQIRNKIQTYQGAL